MSSPPDRPTAPPASNDNDSNNESIDDNESDITKTPVIVASMYPADVQQTGSLQRKNSPFVNLQDSPGSSSTANEELPAQWPQQLDAIEFERSTGRHRAHAPIAIIPEDRADFDIDSVLTPRGPLDSTEMHNRHDISGLPHLRTFNSTPEQESARMSTVPENEPEATGLSLKLPQRSSNASDSARYLTTATRPFAMTDRTGYGSGSCSEYGFHSTSNIFTGSDDAVQSTTYDAAASKHSATVVGYYEDPYCEFFVRRPVKRSPLINRGYYARVAGVRQVVKQFFECVPKGLRIQVVNLGSGLDTTFFWLNDWLSSAGGGQRDWCMFEVDFPEVTFKKRSVIMKHEMLWKKIAEKQEDITTSAEGTFLMSSKLRMVAVDIRRIDDMQEDLLAAGFQSDLPTLFLCECVLVYMQSLHSNSVVRWASSATTAPACIVTYEQMNPHDAFGRTMVRNLEARGCPLLGIYDYPTLEAQKQRYKDLGWDHCEIVDMNDVYDIHLDRMEVMKIQRLELFDEIEEWRLIQAHYFIAVTIKGQGQASKKENHLSESSDEQAVATPRDPSYLQPMKLVWKSHAHGEMPRFTTEEIRRRSIPSVPRGPTGHL